MKKVKLLVADVDEMHIQRIAHALTACQDIEFASSAADGHTALKEIAIHRPNVLITDIQLPGLDGLMLLKDLQNHADPPASIICTRFYSDISISSASRYGAKYFMYKPIDYARVPEIVRECHRSTQSVRRQREASERIKSHDAAMIRDLLCEMGIPPNLNGSMYLIEIMQSLADDALPRNLSKDIYARISKKLASTPQRIERSIRTAISIACERGSIGGTFPRRPTNREFIEYLSMRVKQLQEN